MAVYNEKGADVVAGYFITNEQGDVLTSVKDTQNLEWTMQALMEEEKKRAVIYRNPYQIPRRVSSQFSENYLLFKVHVQSDQAFAGYEDTLSAECIGAFSQFKTGIPAMQSQSREHNFMARAYRNK